MIRPVDDPRPRDWEPCPRGEVGRLVDHLQTRRRRQALTTGALSVSAVCLLLAAGFFLVPRPGGLVPAARVQRIGGLSCYEVDAQLDAYVAGTLDAETVHKIDAHVAQCRYCRDCLQRLRDQAQQPPATAANPHRSLQRILVSQSL